MIGQRLGAYEIVAKVGEGGMGEVYRARDVRLDRSVAIKVLPEVLAGDPVFRDRFDREARAISQLAHPNICTLFDVGEVEARESSQAPVRYLVMEYLEGTTLEERLRQGALPLDQALTIAIQIADALSAAHRQGIVHRDLKPGNVMLTKAGAKLLDFGLAKTGVPVVSGTLSMLPTTPPNLTQQGAILGTFQYMAPEQLEGLEADARTDIFAFGALLYEMIAGRRAFEGKSQASLISAIMSAEPRPLTELQTLTPPALEHLVWTCLRKDPDDRYQTAHDLVVQLRWIAQPGSQSQAASALPAARLRSKRGYGALVVVAAVMLGSILTVLVLQLLRQAPASPEEMRFDVQTPNMRNPYLISISPDGRHIAYVADDADVNPSVAASTAFEGTALFVHDLQTGTSRRLNGTDRAVHPFWSPDSRSIGFSAEGKLRRIDIAGGPPQTICEGAAGGLGTWNRDGTIVFQGAPDPVLYKVSALGGTPGPITTLDKALHQTAHRWPYFLPDGNHFLYSAWSEQPADRAIFVGSLDSARSTRVVGAESMAMYAPGYILYLREGTLLAQPFDAKGLRTAGGPIRIADDIPFNINNGRAGFAVSQTGALIYRTGSGAATTTRFAWFDRAGKELAPVGDPGPYAASFDLSADGKQLVVSKASVLNYRPDIWLFDVARGAMSRVTDNQSSGDVVISPDGQRVAFSINPKGSADIHVKNANGLGEETTLVESPDHEYVEDWSKDGQYIAYVSAQVANPAGAKDIWAVPLLGDRKPIHVVHSAFSVDEPHFSFDTRWMAYASREPGAWQVYVTSFPAADQKIQISTAGGSQPRWRRDGRELYFLGTDGRLMAVDLALAGATIEPGIPHPLFDTALTLVAQEDQYAAMPDGQRFLLLKPVAGGASVPITVNINWQSALTQAATH